MDYKNLKEFYNRFIHGKNTIDRIMTDRLDDYYIIEDFPLPVKIGTKTIYIGNLTRQTYRDFLRKYAEAMSVFGCEKLNIAALSDHRQMKTFLLLDQKLEKRLMRLIKETVLKEQEYYHRIIFCDGLLKVKLPKVSYGYLKRNVTNDGLIQILFLIWFYNFSPEKKNFFCTLEKAGLTGLMQTYISGWLQSLGGVTGKSVQPRFDASSFIQDVQQKETNQPIETAEANNG